MAAQRDTVMRQFPTPLVVGFDGSPASLCAAGAAVDIAERSGSKAHLVTVIRGGESERGGEGRARRMLRDYTTGLRATQRRLVTEGLRVGDAPTEIARVADEVDAGLIVVGASHRTGLAKLLLGSTVESLLQRVPCPLLILSGDRVAWPPDEVVIGDDATAEARQAGDLASEIGALYEAQVTLLEAMPMDGQIAEAASWMGSVRELFEDRLQDRADDVERACGSRPTVRLVDGAAARALMALVGGDRGRRTLVALGTGGRAGLASVLHPSVALAVAHGTTGPVLVSPVGDGGVRSADRPRASAEG